MALPWQKRTKISLDAPNGGDNENTACNDACEKFLLSQLGALTKDQILDIVLRYCSKDSDNRDGLLIHLQKWKDSARNFPKSSFSALPGDTCFLETCLFVGPLTTHNLAMTSTGQQRAFQLYKSHCERFWKNLKWRPGPGSGRGPSWCPKPCEEYYLWLLNGAFDFQNTAQILLTLMKIPGHKLCSRSDVDGISDTVENDSMLYDVSNLQDSNISPSRAWMIQSVITTSSISMRSLGSILVRLWLKGLRNALSVLVEAGAEVVFPLACRITGLDHECDGIYIRGTTKRELRKVDGFGPPTENLEEHQSDLEMFYPGQEHSCRVIALRQDDTRFNNPRWCIINDFTDELFYFMDEIQQNVHKTDVSFFVSDERLSA